MELQIRHDVNRCHLPSLPLYPEYRSAIAPSAERLIQVFNRVSRIGSPTPPGTSFRPSPLSSPPSEGSSSISSLSPQPATTDPRVGELKPLSDVRKAG
jgi:hypothetical protein